MSLQILCVDGDAEGTLLLIIELVRAVTHELVDTTDGRTSEGSFLAEALEDKSLHRAAVVRGDTLDAVRASVRVLSREALFCEVNRAFLSIHGLERKECGGA